DSPRTVVRNGLSDLGFSATCWKLEQAILVVVTEFSLRTLCNLVAIRPPCTILPFLTAPPCNLTPHFPLSQMNRGRRDEIIRSNPQRHHCRRHLHDHSFATRLRPRPAGCAGRAEHGGVCRPYRRRAHLRRWKQQHRPQQSLLSEPREEWAIVRDVPPTVGRDDC